MQAEIPDELRAPAEAALGWLNAERGTAFELTGVVELDEGAQGGTRALGLVLCDGEICTREDVRIERRDGGYHFETQPAPELGIPPLLDPPAGMRRGWVDEQLGKYAFILLLFYRGRW